MQTIKVESYDFAIEPFGDTEADYGDPLADDPNVSYSASYAVQLTGSFSQSFAFGGNDARFSQAIT